MEIKKVWSVYFTGTQTTSKIVEEVAKELGEKLECPKETYDFSLPEARMKPMKFQEGEIVILGTPVIAGRVPNVLLKYLSTIEGNKAIGVPIVVYGNRNYDDALIELRDIMEEGQITTIGGGAFIGEHSFSQTLAQGRPDEKDLEVARKFAGMIYEKIMGKEPIKEVKIKGIPKPYRGYYMPQDRKKNHIDIRKVKPVTDEKKCSKCGLCAQICTMGSIDKEDFSMVKGICIKCCACVKRCPNGAKYYDDAGYLYHKEELETQWKKRREPELFL